MAEEGEGKGGEGEGKGKGGGKGGWAGAVLPSIRATEFLLLCTMDWFKVTVE